MLIYSLINTNIRCVRHSDNDDEGKYDRNHVYVKNYDNKDNY